MEVIIEKMKKISLMDDPLPLLIEIKSNIIAASSADLTQTFEIGSNLLQIVPLFDFLNTNNQEQILITIDILGYVLSKIKPEYSVEYFMKQFILCLQHPHEKVRLFALKQFHDFAAIEETAKFLLEHSDLLPMIFTDLGNPRLEFIKLNQEIIIRLSGHPGTCPLVFSDECFRIMKCVMGTSDSYKFHLYDLCVKVSLKSPEGMNIMTANGILNNLMNEVFGSDLLIQMNALQLLSELVESSVCLETMRSEGIVSKLSQLLESSETDMMLTILVPGLLKFFGNLGAVQPQILVEEEPIALTEIMRRACDFDDLPLQLISLETLCHIGTTIEGKEALRKFDEEVKRSLREFFRRLPVFPTEMKVRVLDSLAKLFYLPIEKQTEDMLEVLEKWFLHLSPESPITPLFKLAKQPFSDVTVSVLNVFHAISLCPWGLKLIRDEPGFFEWLLNRDSCRDKETKDIRFDIISTIHNMNLASKEILGEDLLNRIEMFYKQGPFFVEVESSLACEGK